VKSALHRARVTLAKQYHTPERNDREGLRVDAATQTLLERYLHAWEIADVDGLVALMQEGATFTMPPSPSWYRGRDAIRAVLSAQAFAAAALHYTEKLQLRLALSWWDDRAWSRRHPALGGSVL
jgi:hypothetical protein